MEKEFTAVREFSFDSQRQMVRTMINRDGEPWFVAKDVCDVLEISNSRDALQKLDDDERDCVGITDAIDRDRQTNIINESGLYNLIFRSNKTQAKVFRKWVTSEVLPTIRKQGYYFISHRLDIPDNLDQACALYSWSRKQRIALAGQVKKLRDTERACLDRISHVSPPLQIPTGQQLVLPSTATEPAEVMQ